MAVTVDELIIEIQANTAGVRKDLDKVNKKLGQTNKTVKQSGLGFARLGKIIAAVGFAQVGKSVVSTSMEFEDLQATLRAVTGSAEGAAISFDLIRKFTAGTTFQLQNVTESFITLLNAGVTPTTEVLGDFGNVAAAFNRDITQLARAVFNATTGEMEMLKQFGIVARQQGNKIKVTFDSVTEEIDRDSSSIVNYIRRIGSERFPTALEERLKTLTGAVSNMKDSMAEASNAIGEGGLRDALRDGALALKEVLDESRHVARFIGKILGEAFRLLGRAVSFVVDNLRSLLVAMTIYAAFGFGPMVLKAATSMATFARATMAARLAMLGLNKISKRNIFLLVALALGVIAEQMGYLETAFDKMSNAMPDWMKPEKIDESEKSIEELNAEIRQLLDDLKEGKGSFEDLDNMLKLLSGNSHVMAEVQEMLNAALARGNITLDEANAKYREYLESLGPVGKSMAMIGEAVESLATSFSENFVNALLDGKNALEEFKDFAKNVVSKIISIFMDMLIIQPIIQAILGAFGISTVPQSQIVATPIGMSSSSSAPKQGGGRVHAGRPTWVGEGGPELFIPYSQGKVLNAADSRNATGNQSIVVNQSLNFATGVVPTVRTEIVKLLPQISEVTKASVFEAATRGGQFGRALQGGVG